MKSIYEPKGRAREFSELACNLYSGCGHGCLYCWAPGVLHKSRAEFAIVAPRPNILEQLEKDAAKLALRGEKRRVLFCFSTDPYQPADYIHRLTRSAIEMLHRHGLGISILSKGSTLALRDFDLFTSADAFAMTLTLLDRWKDFEPKASSPQERMDALKFMHEHGIETWVSLEPVLEADQSLEIIRQTQNFVDHYKIGKLNHYNPEDFGLQPINWRAFGQDAIALCEKLGKPYYIKSDLAAFLQNVPFRNTDNRCYGWQREAGAAP